MVRTLANLDTPQPSTSGREYLLHMMHRLLDFRKPEIESLASMAGCSMDQLTWRRPAGDVDMSPFWYITLPCEEAARAIAQRTLLTKSIIEVWGEGSSREELQASIEACPLASKEHWLREGVTFKVVVESFGKSIAMQEQLSFMHWLEFIPFKGKVRLRDPELVFRLIVCNCDDNQSLVEEGVPSRMYFGREVAVADRSLLDTYSLSRRAYLGPTSMDTELACVMCNMAKLRRGQLVLDPYAGTGSILVAAAQYGARVMGADIDVRVIRGEKMSKTGRVANIFTNFEQYGLPHPLALVRMDMHRHPLRPGLEELFDAVIGDPPYGVRAGGRKTIAKEVLITNRETYIASTAPYTMGECLRDLLDHAARLLKVGGRLVYFMPATPETYAESEIPTHPTLQLVANSEQILTIRYSRRLITMEKVCKYDSEAAAAHHAAHPDPTMMVDRLYDIVYESYYDENGRYIGDSKPRADKKCRSKQT